MVRLCGASLGLLAFSVAIFQGLAAGNPVEATLIRSVYALAIFCALGLMVGWVAFRVLDEHALKCHSEMFKDGEESETADSEGADGEAASS